MICGFLVVLSSASTAYLTQIGKRPQVYCEVMKLITAISGTYADAVDYLSGGWSVPPWAAVDKAIRIVIRQPWPLEERARILRLMHSQTGSGEIYVRHIMTHKPYFLLVYEFCHDSNFAATVPLESIYWEAQGHIDKLAELVRNGRLAFSVGGENYLALGVIEPAVWLLELTDTYITYLQIHVDVDLSKIGLDIWKRVLARLNRHANVCGSVLPHLPVEVAWELVPSHVSYSTLHAATKHARAIVMQRVFGLMVLTSDGYFKAPKLRPGDLTFSALVRNFETVRGRFFMSIAMRLPMELQLYLAWWTARVSGYEAPFDVRMKLIDGTLRWALE